MPAREENKYSDNLSIVVLGASGDLAKKKTFPALFSLFALGYLPENTRIYGYARSELTEDKLHESIGKNLKEWPEKKEDFFKIVHYLHGKYDEPTGFKHLNDVLTQEEKGKADRLFYFAVPPSVYVDAAQQIHANVFTSSGGWNRAVFEKPFGEDVPSADKLQADLTKLFTEDQIYRIDHYLGKEMIQNVLVLRHGNTVFEPIWNKDYIQSVQIVFREDFGIEGRAGYFEEIGIIRDIIQNHMIQMLAMFAMETPKSLGADDILNAKTAVLEACQELRMDETVFGQYTAGKGKKGYLDEEGVPKDSKTATFTATVVHIENERWKGVPFILTCGKGLETRKSEIRIQFKEREGSLFPQGDLNELVIRVSPEEAMYIKFNSKKPGFSFDVVETELDLTFKKRFKDRIPEAYERLILDCLKGDHKLFVRFDELRAAWKMFDPLLRQVDKMEPEKYEFGSRGPKGGDELKVRFGYKQSKNYDWPTTSSNAKL